jgi:hypothetical protein
MRQKHPHRSGAAATGRQKEGAEARTDAPTSTATPAAPPVAAANARARALPGDLVAGDWTETYLEELAKTCEREESATVAGVSLRTVFRRKAADPKFAELENEVMQQVQAAKIESEITRRAIRGVVSTTVSRDGKTITEKVEYSDTLLLRLAERLETGSWRQKHQVEQTTGPKVWPTRAERKAALAKMREDQEAAKAALGGGLRVRTADQTGQNGVAGSPLPREQEPGAGA